MTNPNKQAAKFYRARHNEIVDEAGKQIAVVLPSNCTKKFARQLAAFAAQQANHIERDKERRKP